jgi:hypothetical protein
MSLYGVIILSDNYQLPLPVSLFIVSTQPIQPTTHTGSGGAVRSNKQQFPDKTSTLYFNPTCHVA